MSSLAWINRGGAAGSWGAPETLPLPCDARGVLLAEGVFETVLVRDGRPQLLEAHLERWQRSAVLLGLAAPPTLAVVLPLVQAAIQRSGIRLGALRLNWCRGSGPRGLSVVDPQQESADTCLFWLQLSAATPSFAPVAVIVSPTEVRHATSVLSHCKSFGYGSALVARRQASEAGADDALLNSSSGGLCCGTSANLLVQIDDRWYTPPLESGCLAGIMRQRALELGLVESRPISLEQLQSSQGARLLNSLSCRPISRVNQTDLAGPTPQQASVAAELLWRQLQEP